MSKTVDLFLFVLAVVLATASCFALNVLLWGLAIQAGSWCMVASGLVGTVITIKQAIAGGVVFSLITWVGAFTMPRRIFR